MLVPLLTSFMLGGAGTIQFRDRNEPSQRQSGYAEAIRRAADMVTDPRAAATVRRYGLDILSLTWEDTGRFKNSSVGPNISDMTIQVRNDDTRGRTSATAMPVIRYPNFSDRTGDLDPFDFVLLVGNQRNRPLKRISLYDFLERPGDFMTNPDSWPTRRQTLLAPRDDRVLVSAQACFLPVPRSGKALFNPVLFNYQSVPGDPAVLAVLVTREGTSMTVIDNKGDNSPGQWNWGQRLFFNLGGMRSSFTGQRESDFLADPNVRPSDKNSDRFALNVVLLIQIPLKQREQHRPQYGIPGGFGGGGAAEVSKAKRGVSDTENAVIGHGAFEGPFTEVDNLPIERDPRFPVRVTVQFYKATSTGTVSEQDMRQIKRDIDLVYARTENVGSLVTQGETGRPTEYDGIKVQPMGWWSEFWNRYERSTGVRREDAIRRLQALLGKDYMMRPVCDLYVRDLLRTKGTQRRP